MDLSKSFDSNFNCSVGATNTHQAPQFRTKNNVFSANLSRFRICLCWAIPQFRYNFGSAVKGVGLPVYANGKQEYVYVLNWCTKHILRYDFEMDFSNQDFCNSSNIQSILVEEDLDESYV